MTADEPTYIALYWTPAARDELRAALARIPDYALRQVVADLISTDDPALFVAVLRGDLFGLAKRGEGR